MNTLQQFIEWVDDHLQLVRSGLLLSIAATATFTLYQTPLVFGIGCCSIVKLILHRFRVVSCHEEHEIHRFL
jgi:hypothetical protein